MSDVPLNELDVSSVPAEDVEFVVVTSEESVSTVESPTSEVLLLVVVEVTVVLVWPLTEVVEDSVVETEGEIHVTNPVPLVEPSVSAVVVFSLEESAELISVELTDVVCVLPVDDRPLVDTSDVESDE